MTENACADVTLMEAQGAESETQKNQPRGHSPPPTHSHVSLIHSFPHPRLMDVTRRHEPTATVESGADRSM